MKRIKLAAMALGLAAGLAAAPSVAATASVRPAESVYTVTTVNRCFSDQIYSECVYFQAHTTYSSTQIWINGNVSCHWSGSYTAVDITWCGLGGGNGTGYLNEGVNWNVPGWNANGLYARMNIVSNGGGCVEYGNDSKIGSITYWYNGTYQCEGSP